MTPLGEQLAQLDAALLDRLCARGFSAEQLLQWASAMGGDPLARNRLPGRVEAMPLSSLTDPNDSDALAALGREALSAGEVAFCVLAGGMATRMGGVVKALAPALPGVTFLDLRLAQLRRLAERYAPAPLFLMTSEATDGPIRAALGERGVGRERAATFEQFVSLRLCPDRSLFADGGKPSVYATGHGDLPDALRQSGLLAELIAKGGRTVWISNLDNLGAGPDERVLGQHLAGGKPVTAELCDKRAGDAGGGPVLHDGRAIIAESFRLPANFDGASVPVFNTNTFLVETAALAELSMSWTYLQVHKQVGGRTAVQFERLIGELTMALPTQMLRVPRDGPRSRFLPCKSHEDLALLRPQIEAIARELGVPS